jgi:recombination protein RecA
MNREEALDVALGQIERQFGKGSVMRMSDQAQVSIAAISTGSLSLDMALGIGGLPRGRVVEVFGPESSGKTTLVYHVIAEAQRRGGICAFIDAEHAMDPQYARHIGVNIDDLLVSQPDTGEQALEICELLVRSGAVDIVAVDSVAALTPKAEIEGEMGDTHVGLQARLMSQALRKLAGTLHRTDTICLFTNQLREKIGVMFGCFHYDARVVLEDGTTEKIGKIVNQRLPVRVMSMDPATGKIEPRRILSYFDNGPTDEFWQFEVEAGGGSGRRKFACTSNHIIFTPAGEQEAGELEVGDEVLVAVKDYALTAAQRQLVYGGVLGDGSLRTVSEQGVTFRVGHGSKQSAYCEWKRDMLAPYAHSISAMGNGIGFDTVPIRELRPLHEAVYTGVCGGKKRVTPELVGQLDERAIAVWYADDGTFSGSYARWGHGKAEICAVALDRESRELLAERCDELGMGRPTVTERGLLFSGDRTRRFHERIAPYIHPNVDYKLHPSLRGRFAWPAVEIDEQHPEAAVTGRPTLAAVPMRITKKYLKPQSRKTHRFDLEIEGNHTYLVDHVVVHNSPETTPGGRALKFYASVRLDIRRIETLKDGQEAYGNRVRVKVVKNKVAPPFKQAEFDIIYGTGISWEGTVLDVGIEKKVVQKSGSYFSFGDERLGQGRQNATAFLREHPDLVQQILSRIQMDAAEGQIVSARLLPAAGGDAAATEVTPIEDEPAAADESALEVELEVAVEA